MRILFPVLFLAIAIAVFFGLQSMNSSQAETRKTGQANGFSLILDRFATLSGGTKSMGQFVSYLPEPSEAWTRRAYEAADGEALTNVQFGADAQPSDSSSFLLQWLASARASQTDVVATFASDDQTIVVAISKDGDDEIRAVLTGATTSHSTQEMAGFASVDGLLFVQAPDNAWDLETGKKVPTNYRTFTANMSDEFRIVVLANASELAVSQVIQGIDVVGLNGEAAKPDPSLTAGTGLQIERSVALSDLKPEPTIDYRAYALLQDGADEISDEEQRLLRAIASGQISQWQQIYAIFGLKHGLSDQLIAVLGEEPPLPPIDAVKIDADKMLTGNDGRYGSSDIAILEALAVGAFASQADAKKAMSTGTLYSPPVTRLISRLPEGETLEEESSDQTSAGKVQSNSITVRRGTNSTTGFTLTGNCKIEQGVRRCFAESDLTD